MTRASVAVFIACGDDGRTLADVLRSVRDQTLAPVEILIVDEGSTDLYTRHVLANLERTGQRFLHADATWPAAWYAAIRSTEAAYVLLLDAGALLQPTFIAEAATTLDERAGAAFVTCAPSFGLIDALAGAPLPDAAMFRRQALSAAFGFGEHTERPEERDFWISLLARGFVGAVLPEPLLNPAKAGSHQTSRKPPRAEPSLEECWRKHEGMLREHAEAVLLAKERLLLEQQERHERLHDRRTAVQKELDELQRDIDAVVAGLQAAGRARVDLGDLRRTEPISAVWGLDRGMPLDRYYINAFLDRHRADVRGRVLEVKDPGYTHAFGDDRVTASDVLDIDRENAQANVLADLANADQIASDTYDCFILTQVLGLIYDVPAALATAYRVLKPGGVLLCTVPASGRISYEGSGVDGDYWRFTEASIRRLFSEIFPLDAFEVTGFGNVLANAAFLYGLAPHELTRDELDATDPFFPVVYAVRAQKPVVHTAENPAKAGSHERRGATENPGATVVGSGSSPSTALGAGRISTGAILAYHRIADDRARPDLCVSPEHFRAHLQQIEENGYSVLSLHDMAQAVRRGAIPDRSVAITFDDGYLESLTCAARILTERSLPATFFIVGDTLNGLAEFWWDTLGRVFLADHPLPNGVRVELPGRSLDLPTRTTSERTAAYERLVKALYSLPLTDRDPIVQHIANSCRIAARSLEDARPLTSAELTRLADLPGVEIGAHTEHHVWLPAETGDIRLAEIAGSRSRLSRLLGRAISSFAYPYGGHDARTVDLVREAGYEQAVTVEERPVHARENPFLLPRYQIRDCDGRSFGRCLRGIFDAGATDHPQRHAEWPATTSTSR